MVFGALYFVACSFRSFFSLDVGAWLRKIHNELCSRVGTITKGALELHAHSRQISTLSPFLQRCVVQYDATHNNIIMETIYGARASRGTTRRVRGVRNNAEATPERNACNFSRRWRRLRATEATLGRRKRLSARNETTRNCYRRDDASSRPDASPPGARP